MPKFMNAWENYGLTEAQYLFAWTTGFQSRPDLATGKHRCHYTGQQRKVWQAGRRAAKKGY